ncbi:MAG: MlaE family lipid ABC transporter permease subunit [Planctomycetota bacterium]
MPAPPAVAQQNPATPVVEARQAGDVLTLTLGGRFDMQSTADAWPRAIQAVAPAGNLTWRTLVVDATDITYLDGAGLGLLIELRRRQIEATRRFELVGLRDSLRDMLDMFPETEFIDPPDEIAERQVIVEIGRATLLVMGDIRKLLSFTGELFTEAVRAVVQPSRMRWKDMFLAMETSGVNALPIVLLLGFLFGFILAFQAAIPLKQFGAELFVIDLVSISLVRELGPLLTAIILAGRSGSAFAAELGTMKVNEELNALTTMGISPVRFLALPRVTAVILMAPLLTVICNLVGIIGGAVVCGMLGFPFALIVNQVLHAINFVDVLGGLFKVSTFALLVAAIGCQRGLNTGTGASAVGASTTQAVVAGLILIIVCDGVFALLFYAVGL